jgi:proline iminopeptidase
MSIPSKTSPFAPGDHFFSTSDGSRVHYFINPPPSGSGPLFALIAVGWGAGSAWLHQGLAPRLTRRGHTVLVLSPRGNGDSDRPTDATTMCARVMAEDLEALRLHLGLDAFPALLGHSHAGAIALRYAERFPARVERLVLVDAQLMDAPASTLVADMLSRRESIAGYAGAVEQLRALRGKGPFPADDEEFAATIDKLLPWYFSDVAKTEVLRVHMAAGPGRPVVYAMQTNGHDMKEGNKLPLIAEAGRVEAKVLVVWGAEDAICDVNGGRKLVEVLQDHQGKTELRVLEGVGHFPWIEDPMGFWEAVEGFVEVK